LVSGVVWAQTRPLVRAESKRKVENLFIGCDLIGT